MSPGRRHQHLRAHTRAQPGADDVATHPGTPPTIRLRGGEEVGALVARARWSLGAPHTTRFLLALQDAGEERSRDLLASDLTWRPLARVHAHTWRWLVAVLMQDWKSQEGWRQLTTQPGQEGARQGVILRLRVDQGLVVHPDHHAPRHHTRPASTGGQSTGTCTGRRPGADERGGRLGR